MDEIIDADDYCIDINLDIGKPETSDQIFNELIKIEEPVDRTIPDIKEEHQEVSPSNELSDEALIDHSTDETNYHKLGESGVNIGEKSKNIKKKRRLKGSELITSIRHDPIFSQHTE